MDLTRVLNSVGKSAFVKYYYNFKNLNRDECVSRFEEDYTDKAKNTRTGHAQRIFKENQHIAALEAIIKSDRVDFITRSKAKEILAKEK